MFLLDIFDTEVNTVHGLDRLQLMVRLISVIEADRSEKKIKSEYNKLKSWIVSQIHRGLTKEESINLLQGILRYIRSDAETNERIEAMKYLFDAEFLLPVGSEV